MSSHHQHAAGIDRRTLIKWAGTGTVALAAAPLLAACRGGTVPASQGGAAKPRRGGQLTLVTGDGLGRDFFVGNSFGPQSLAWYQFVWPLFLYRPGTFEHTPALAERVEPAADLRTHTITLRSGLTFHDSSPLDAAAVVANLQAAFNKDDRLRGPGPYQMIPLFWGGFPGIVTGVTATDKRTVRLTLSEPRYDVRAGLAAIPIYNPAVLANKNYGTDVGALRDAGSGPFRLERYQPGVFVEYSRVKGFVEEAYLDRLRIQLVADPPARFLALQGGQAQAAIGLSKADWDANAGNPRFRAHIGNKGTNVFLGLNPHVHPELAKREVREAVARALNRQGYVASFWGKGLAEPASQVALVPGVPGYNNSLQPLPHSPDDAKKLLAQAGVSRLQLSVVNPPAFGAVPELAAMLEAMAGDLAKVGITLKVNITDVPGWLAGQDQNDFSVVPYGNNGGAQAAVAALLFNRPPNRAQIVDADVYRPKVLQALKAPSAEAQAKILQDLLATAARDVVAIPLAYTAPAALSLATVHDLAVSASPMDSQHRAWIEQ